MLYPVFVHTYLRLVACGAGALAAELLRAHRARMTDASGRRSPARAHELSQLQAVALPQHLETNPFAKAARRRGARPLVRMCAYSFELLMPFLHGHKLWLLLAVINENLRFEVRGGAAARRRCSRLRSRALARDRGAWKAGAAGSGRCRRRPSTRTCSST